MKERITLIVVLLAGILLSSLAIAWWRRVSDASTVKKRLPLAEELADFSAPAEVLQDHVVIGEYFSEFDGVPSKAGGTWPSFRGANHDNIAADGARLAESWPASGPPVLWSIALGEGYAGPAVRDGCVYLLDYDNKANADALRCFSMDKGKEIWRRWYRVRVKRNHGMSRTVPAVSGRYVVTIGPRCHVMCVNSRTGGLRWGIDLEKEWGTTVPMWYAGECPLIDGNQAVIAVGGKTALLIGVDLETGKVVWQTPNPRRWQMSHSSVVPLQVDGKKMYVYCALGGIVGVSAETADRGAVLWETDEWNHQVVAPAPVSLGDGRLFVTAGYGVGSAMFQVTQESGRYSVKLLYRSDKKSFACEQHTPVFYKGYLYSVLPADAGAARRQAVCMDPAGRIMWHSGSGERFGLGPFMIADGKMLILDDNGLLTMIRATESGYVKIARAKVLEGNEAWAPMALVNGLLLVRDYGEMRCLDLRAKEQAPSHTGTAAD